MLLWLTVWINLHEILAIYPQIVSKPPRSEWVSNSQHNLQLEDSCKSQSCLFFFFFWCEIYKHSNYFLVGYFFLFFPEGSNLNHLQTDGRESGIRAVTKIFCSCQDMSAAIPMVLIGNATSWEKEAGPQGRGTFFSWLTVLANMSKWWLDSSLQNTVSMGLACRFYSKSLVYFLVIQPQCDFQSSKGEPTQAPGTYFSQLPHPHSSCNDPHLISPVCFNFWREKEKEWVYHRAWLFHEIEQS